MYIDKWRNKLITENKSPLTIKGYEEALVHFLDYIKTDILVIEKSDIYQFIAHRQQCGISIDTIKKEIAGIKNYFKYLFNEEIINSNPTIDIKIKGENKKLPNYHSINVMNDVLDNPVKPDPKYKTNQIRDLALVEIAYSSGLRLEELHSLEICKINTDEKLLRITKGERVKKLFRDKGITQKSNPHTLRHTFATHLLSSKVGIRDIQEMLGHADLNTTQIYTYVDETTMKEEYNNSHPRAKSRT
ncbi:tyrosine-type recombinase/integrase [Acinetobacter pittii]|uniref:tyrosine-type recombinase/integrase n=1 Tax=Acinetobacter pittii TaxID=48296 RepID=UPI00069706BC|nr:tyrosine-type recombinase/integrase [Acinetobacter pittii]